MKCNSISTLVQPKRVKKNGKGGASRWDLEKPSKRRRLEEEGRSEFRGQGYVQSAATGHIPSPSHSMVTSRQC